MKATFRVPACAVLTLLMALTLARTGLAQAGATAGATPARAAEEVRVIPQPKRSEASGEVFRLARGVTVTPTDVRSEEDAFAARDFADDARETAGVALSVARRRARRAILLGTFETRAVTEALARAGLQPPSDLNDEGYVLSVRADEVVVAGRTSAGVFYGMQTLKQLVRGAGEAAYLQGVRITDWPTMRWRAVSDDISRGPVPTVDYIKRQLRTFAFLKLNMHSFYMEHVFKSESHPLIGPEGGSLTPEEIRELVAYARRYHIELVPEQQTFGHLHKALRLEKYGGLAEVPNGDVLSPQQPGTYQLIADWYKELNELFPGQFFHIGEDETFELGEGQSREEVKAKGVGAVYFEHLRRVRELLQPYHRRLMFWGDIALNHPDLIGSIPKDLIVMNWDYGRRDSYAARIKPFKDAGLAQFVCPGVQNWNQIFPNEEAAVVNIPGFVRDGQAAGVMGMMNTSWDDDGETLFEMTWYGIALGAAASWQDAPLDVAGFDRSFDWSFFRHEGDQLTKSIRALGSVNALLGIGSSDDVFWRDPFTASYIEDRARPLAEKTREMRLVVEGVAETIMHERAGTRRNQSMLDAMMLAARRFDHMGRRMQTIDRLSRDYWDAYLNLGDQRRVRRLRSYSGGIYNALREMAEELTILREQYRRQWLAENRPYWLDSILARYDLAINYWLSKSRALTEALRSYDESSELPPPEEFGLGPRPTETDAPRRR